MADVNVVFPECGSSLLIVASLFFLSLISITLMRSRQGKKPPVISGWIPWLGCAIEFGKAPLNFIKAARDKHGKIFTFYAAGQRMTFLTDPRDFHLFFNSPQADFQQAVQEPVWNTASIDKPAFFKYHRQIHDLVKGRLAPSNLHKLAPRIGKHLEGILALDKDSDKVDLMDFVREVVFTAVVPTLFGKGVLPDEPDEFRQFVNKFVQFDSQFEHGAKLPDWLLKDWAHSKQYLLRKFKEVWCGNDTKHAREDTLLESLFDAIDNEDNCSPNYSVLMLWAALANAVPITFWVVVFILSDGVIKKEVIEEAEKVLGPASDNKGSLSELQLTDVKGMMLIEQCILEAIRLRSPGMIARRLTQPLHAHGFTVPAGDLLMVSPYWTHLDESVFQKSKHFNPDRWKNWDAKSPAADNFIAFGGGRYQCPGRWFALMEIQMFVAVLMSHFEIELLDGVLPCPSPQHVVGVPHPEKPCLVKVRVRT